MMIRLLAFIAALWASTATAQNYPATFKNGNDVIAIEPFGTSEAVVTYSNHISMASGPGTTTLSAEAAGVVIVVDVTIVVNGEGSAEVAIVQPRGGYIAIPDRLAVDDGSDGVFRVMLPMY